MARFRASIRGQRGAASRLGSKSSGIVAHVNAWDNGVSVFGTVNAEGIDEFHVYSNGGSNGRPGMHKLLAIITPNSIITNIKGEINGIRKND